MGIFQNFKNQYGNGIDKAEISPEIIAKYENVLPVELIEFWKEEGFSGYNEGLIWVTNPDDFIYSLEEWLDPQKSPGAVILRTAFADLFLWSAGQVYFLNVQSGNITAITPSITQFLNEFLCKESIRKKVLKEDVYKDVIKRLRPVTSQRCCAFVPAIPVGGPGTAESVEIVGLKIYLDILSQLVLD
jgi:hypothetical protein